MTLRFRAAGRLLAVFGLLGLFWLSGCTLAPASPAPSLSAPIGEPNWPMEGAHPDRSRFTTGSVAPPLDVGSEYTIGGSTEQGSPVSVADGYLLAEGERKLHAISLAQGEEEWSFNLNGSYVSPTVAGDRVYVRAEAGEEGYVYAIRLADGAKLWQFKFPAVGSSYDNVGGHVTSPVLAEGRLLVGAAKSLQALDVDDGRLLWTFEMVNPVASSAAVAGDTAYVTDFNHLYAVDVEDGSLHWQVDFGQSVSLLFAPVVLDDQIIVSSYDTIYAFDRGSGAERWSRRFADTPVIPSGAAEEQVYVKSSGWLSALDNESGDVLWTYDDGVDFVSLPALTEDELFVVTRAGGKAQLRALQRSSGAEMWKVDNDLLANAAPVVAGDNVYVRTVDGRILGYQSVQKE